MVHHVDMDGLPSHQRLDIEQMYLKTKDKNAEIRIRKRVQDGINFYFLARTRIVADNHPIEEEELIPEQEYMNLTRLRDRTMQVLTRQRICFLWNNKSFEIDMYDGRHKGLVMLLAESSGTDANPGADIPAFITIGKCVTHDARYSDKTLAKRK